MSSGAKVDQLVVATDQRTGSEVVQHQVPAQHVGGVDPQLVGHEVARPPVLVAAEGGCLRRGDAPERGEVLRADDEAGGADVAVEVDGELGDGAHRTVDPQQADHGARAVAAHRHVRQAQVAHRASW